MDLWKIYKVFLLVTCLTIMIRKLNLLYLSPNVTCLVYLLTCFSGLFTLLVYDFGVKGVEVEEVYDLSTQMEK